MGYRHGKQILENDQTGWEESRGKVPRKELVREAKDSNSLDSEIDSGLLVLRRSMATVQAVHVGCSELLRTRQNKDA